MANLVAVAFVHDTGLSTAALLPADVAVVAPGGGAVRLRGLVPPRRAGRPDVAAGVAGVRWPRPSAPSTSRTRAAPSPTGGERRGRTANGLLELALLAGPGQGASEGAHRGAGAGVRPAVAPRRAPARPRGRPSSPCAAGSCAPCSRWTASRCTRPTARAPGVSWAPSPGPSTPCPAEAAFLVRSRPGGLGEAIRQARARSRGAGDGGRGGAGPDRRRPGRPLPAPGGARAGPGRRPATWPSGARPSERLVGRRPQGDGALRRRRAPGDAAARGADGAGGRRVVAARRGGARAPGSPTARTCVFRQIGHRALVEDRRPEAQACSRRPRGRALPAVSTVLRFKTPSAPAPAAAVAGARRRRGPAGPAGREWRRLAEHVRRTAQVGAQSCAPLLDACAPEWAELRPDAFVVDGVWTRTLHFRPSPPPAQVTFPGWLAPLLHQTDGDVSLALHVTPLTDREAAKLVRDHRVLQTSAVIDRAAQGYLSDPGGRGQPGQRRGDRPRHDQRGGAPVHGGLRDHPPGGLRGRSCGRWRAGCGSGWSG